MDGAAGRAGLLVLPLRLLPLFRRLPVVQSPHPARGLRQGCGFCLPVADFDVNIFINHKYENK